MEVRKLLYATDARQPELWEVQRLRDLCSLGLKEVILLQVTKTAGWERSLADLGMKSKIMMVDGPVASSILAAARHEAVSLIAASLNRHVRGRLRRSLTKALFRSSPVPVFTLPEDAQATGSGQKGVFARIIFAADWSAASEKALNYLLNFSKIIDQLEIVHVIDKRLDVKDMRDLKDKLVQTRKIFLEKGIDAEPHIYAGKRPEEIMLAAKDYDATCIVMGTTGKSTLKDLFSRSCSYRVSEASVVPTLVVP